MQYALLVFQDEKRNEDVSEAALAGLHAEHRRLIEALREAGAMIDSTRFKPSFTATTVRGPGPADLTDGPPEQTREQLGGLYLIEVGHLDRALEFARLLPSFTVEVRPIAEAGN